MPGFFGSFKLFDKFFLKPIIKEGDNNVALKNLNKKIECFMFRRTKDKVLKELPPKIEQVSHYYLDKD